MISNPSSRHTRASTTMRFQLPETVAGIQTPVLHSRRATFTRGHNRLKPALHSSAVLLLMVHFLPPQLRASSSGFCFRMPPPDMAVQVPSPGTTVPMQISGHTPAMQQYPGLVLPRGEMKVNPEEQSSLPVATRGALSTYQQLMGRLPQFPRM
jgi:hypothetical protein